MGGSGREAIACSPTPLTDTPTPTPPTPPAPFVSSVWDGACDEWLLCDELSTELRASAAQHPAP
jgi:hypothetical protein